MVKIYLGKTSHRTNQMNIIYLIVATNLQVTKRWEDDSMNDKHKGQEKVPEPKKTPPIKQVFSGGIMVLQELIGEYNYFRESPTTLDVSI